MNNGWIKSAAARHVIAYLTDSRPAWLWSIDGEKPIWSNPAARLFFARQKNNNLKLAPLAIPHGGQIENLMRLGSPGRTSLSRVRFNLGVRTVFSTSTVTPLQMDDIEAILIVGVDPIDKALMNEHYMSEEIISDLFEPEYGFVVLNRNKNPIGGTPTELEEYRKDPVGFSGNEDREILHFSAGPGATSLILLQKDQRNMGAEGEGTRPDDGAIEAKRETKPVKHRNLSSLLDQLAADENLFTPLGPQDDAILWQTANLEPKPQKDEVEKNETGKDEASETVLWKIIGEGFEPAKDQSEKDSTPPDIGATIDEVEEEPDKSRYNFKELSRILTERVGAERQAETGDGQTEADSQKFESSLVNLSEETLILNRLPLGLLIFKGQQILFSNREMLTLIGYKSSATLKQAGLGAIFPLPDKTGDPAGPVTLLIHQNGKKIEVSARLQSITWNGNSALMLSAAPKKNEIISAGGADNTSRIVASLARVENCGHFHAGRSGVIDKASNHATKIWDRADQKLEGRPLSLMLGGDELKKLQAFLEQKAGFAETDSPAILLKTIDPSIEIILFCEGRAGIISGYSGLIRKIGLAKGANIDTSKQGIDPTILKRLARSMRRPLNTIIGFSELISSHSFGPLGNPRYDEYALDINSAGHDILGTIDELENFTQLSGGQYIPAPLELDPGELLEQCLSRVRHQASQSRVLIRSSISGRLPQIKADKATLEQAILNLLASAIEQTPEGGQIIISANSEEGGEISIHVRDSGESDAAFTDNFVVFRDGTDPDGRVLKPTISSVGLALTRSLLAVNTVSLRIDPTAGTGTLLSLIIPADLTVAQE